ncbi:MAG: isopentenyl phosphate kinase family protein [Candidatus Nealsonbacteria bacterium]|nr:isopentenyl phosphate kinase family protein [Candidatus Nealsonbacteria bacterium]
MNRLTIVKIGGSVLTDKDKISFPEPRKKIIEDAARDFSLYLKKHPQERFILIFGAGSFGHPLAEKYNLADLNSKSKNKIGVGLTRNAVQRLNIFVLQKFLERKCPVFSLPPASIIEQNKGKIIFFDTKIVSALLERRLIPTFFGDVVTDKNCEFSICSGDQIAAYLARKLSPQRIFFASDVDGLFTADPRLDPAAKLIKRVKRSQLKNIISQKSKTPKRSDVTGLMRGKLKEISETKCRIVIFNGLKKGNLLSVLENKKIGTEIIS